MRSTYQTKPTDDCVLNTGNFLLEKKYNPIKKNLKKSPEHGWPQCRLSILDVFKLHARIQKEVKIDNDEN